MLSRTYVIVFVLLALFGLTFWLGNIGTTRVLAQAPTAVTPFTLEQITLSFAKSVQGDVIEKRTTARRADASRAILGVFPNSNQPPLRRVDFADGRAVTVVDQLRAKMSVLLGDRERATAKSRLANLTPDCVRPGETARGESTLLGVTVFEAYRNYGSKEFSEWRAPSLQCFPLAMKLNDLSSGKAVPNTEVRPLFLHQGEPSAVLFDESAASKERKPSELKREMYSAMGVTEALCPTCFGKGADADADAQYEQKRLR